ncbi:MAG: hypothetical protein EOO24_32130 [Comamonadaceae bacterium]|nr:MAG: hypothetical protein EOO24_32130 [Comamonadaceae bacterium]
MTKMTVEQLKAANARSLWHPMAHPKAMLDTPPDIIVRLHLHHVDRHGVGARVRLEHLGVAGIDDAVDVAQHVHAREEFLAVEQFQLVRQDGDADAQCMRAVDQSLDAGPHHGVRIGVAHAREHRQHVPAGLADRFAEFAGAPRPVLAFADLVALHGLPEGVRLRRQRTHPLQRVARQSQRFLGVAMPLEQRHADDGAEVEQQPAGGAGAVRHDVVPHAATLTSFNSV